MARVIDGDELAEVLRAEIEEEVSVLRLSAVRPGLATVIVGDDQAAHWYERHLRKLAESLDYRYECEQLYDDATLDDVLATIGKLNADPRISGTLILRPLPAHIPEYEAFAAVDPRKDVEGMHPWNLGLLAIGTPRFVPSTPAACFYLLDAYARSSEEGPPPSTGGRRSSSSGDPRASASRSRSSACCVTRRW